MLVTVAFEDRDYDAYKMERNRLGDMIRSAKSRYECGLIDDMKDNPNLFHGHCRRSLKTKQGVSNVMDGSGRLTETEGEAAAALNTYYHSVFTRDDGSSPLPVFGARTDEKIQDVYIATDQVEEVSKTNKKIQTRHLVLKGGKAVSLKNVQLNWYQFCGRFTENHLMWQMFPLNGKRPTLSQDTRVVPRQLWVTSDRLP